MANTLINLLVKLGMDAKDFNKGVDESEKKAQTGGQKIAAGLSGVGGAVVKGALAAAAAGIVGVSAALATTIGPASDLNETLSKNKVVFGQYSFLMQDWGENAAKTMGMSENAALGAAATYGNLFKSMGMADNQSFKMSQSLVGLAGDLASFNNLDPSEVLDKLRAGLTGEAEPLKTLGVNISAAMIEQKAMTLGLKKFGQELSPAAKAQASYALIMEQTTTAQGDFARTSGGLANQQRIMAATFEDVKAKIGTALLPMVTTIAQAFNDWLSSPATQEGITKIVDGIGTLATEGQNLINLLFKGDFTGLFGLQEDDPIVNTLFDLRDTLIGLATAIPAAFAWLIANPGVIVGILAAIGVAVGFFVYTTVVPALWTMAGTFLATFGPALAVMALIGIAAYLLYQAWTTNFGGIRDILTEVWEGTLKPAFETLWNWLQVNLPLALAWLSDQWENVLLPAITRVWAWIQGTLFPLFVTAYEWLKVKVPEALAWLADKWETVLLPAIKRVWEWMNTVLFPFFKEVGDFISAVFTLAVQELSKAWEEKLLPGIKGVWKFLKEDALPFFKEVGDWLGKTFGPIIATVAGIVRDSLGAAFQWAGEKFAEFRQTLRDLTDWINVLTGKSETVKGNLPPVAENASGGSAAAGTYSWVGERGPELMYFPQDAYIINNLSSQRLVDDLTGGEEVNNSSMVQFNISPHYYKGDEPTLLDEVNDLTLMFGVP
jgi:hypothetical protein